MRTPDWPNDPKRPSDPARPGRPARPGKPASRAQFARLKEILAQDAASETGDLIVQLGAEAPSEAALAAMDEPTRSAVAWAVGNRDEIARRVASDREFATALAADPRAALASLGMAVPDLPARPAEPATTPGRAAAPGPFASLGGRRFDLPEELLEVDLTAQGPTIEQAATIGLVAATIQGAQASPKAWAALRADPPAAVLEASKRFVWTEAGMQPDSPEAASVVQQVSATLAKVLHWSAPSSGTGPTTPTPGGPGAWATVPALVDLEVRAGRVRTVRIPASRTEG